MNILFTKNNSVVSKLICGITKEPISHCAIQVGRFVIQSNFRGVHVVGLDSFIKHNNIEFFISVAFDKEKLLTSLEKHLGHWYDTLGLLYLALKYLFPFLPKKNLWQNSGMYLCTEFVTDILFEKPDSMITPYQLYLKLKEYDAI